ncbi:MAG: ABC transporter substrate-binding protein [Bryobacteraceae bacterium]
MRGVLFVLLLLLAGCSAEREGTRLDPSDLERLSWEEVAAQARNSTVRFGMWGGDEERNRYFRSSVRESLLDCCGIDLRIITAGDTAELINMLLNEKRAGKLRNGLLDMIWINGENFRTAKQGGVLWGPFAQRLPNFGLYSPEASARDFGTPTEGFEAPWQRAQFVMAYDSARVPEPPRTIEALAEWVRRHPGRFTYLAPPDFTGSAFIRHLLLHFGNYDRRFQEAFDEELYKAASERTIAFLNDLRPFLWRKGETYPSTPREQDRLFANHEIDFAMSYGPSFVSVRIARGEFPVTARTFVFDTGTIANYNYLAIPFNAPNAAGALVAITHLMSFEQALDLSIALRSAFPLDLTRLTEEQRAKAEALPVGLGMLPARVLAARALTEPDAEYLVRIERDWLERVLRR